MKRKLSYLSILAGGLLVLAACGGGSDPATSPEESDTPEPDSSSVTTESPESTDTGTSEEESSDTGTSEEPAPTGHTNVDVFYVEEGNIPSTAGEGSLVAGDFAYWAGNGGAVTSAYYTESTDTLAIAYTNTGEWYGVQVFYKAPYLELGTITYDINAKITSSVAGSITISGNVIALEAGVEYDLDLSYTPGAYASVFSMQLGVNGTGVLPSGTIALTGLEIIDTTSTYYQVDFVNSDDSAIDSVMCLAEHTLWKAPADPTAAEGSIFDGWVDENGTKVDLATYVPTGDVTLKATYAEANIDVNYYIGETVIYSTKSYEGGKLTAPTDLGYDECGFGYGVAGWYKESTFSTAWDFDNDTVSEATNLYAKLQVTYSDLYQHEGSWDLSTFSHDEDGALILSGDNGGWGESWHKQINFQPMPVGTSGTAYTLTFEYKANADFACQIYDNNAGSVTSMTLTVSTDSWVTGTLSYTGGSFSANTKWTFELGTKNTGATNELSIRNIAITPAA